MQTLGETIKDLERDIECRRCKQTFRGYMKFFCETCLPEVRKQVEKNRKWVEKKHNGYIDFRTNMFVLTEAKEV